MRYHALASDYDETLARHGRVSEAVVDALARLKASGRRIVLVTGRELDDLARVFQDLARFDRVVAENGALLFDPRTRRRRLLAQAPPALFARTLRDRGVEPLAVGNVVVATREPHEKIVLETIREMGLELQVVFNKGAVMVLPSGINKASGLAVALSDFGLSPHNVVGVGDAENDHALLEMCECGVAVANALPMLKGHADWVTARERGEGVIELIDALVDNDLAALAPRLARRTLVLGRALEGEDVVVPSYGTSVMIAGTSGAGKSTLAAGILERLLEQSYQFCIIDPEGDYQNFKDAVVLGEAGNPPTVEEAVDVLRRPDQNLVVNLLGVAREERPRFFDSLFPALLNLRAATGRPHWIVVDEAHHLFPAHWMPGEAALPRDLSGLVLITVHPDHVSPALLGSVDTVLAIGEDPTATLGAFARAAGETPPRADAGVLRAGEVLVWWRRSGATQRIRSIPPKEERLRHVRKYAAGELPPDRSFYFRGRDGRLNLRAQNLALFMQIAEGVDDDTWLHHLRRHDYSRWFRETIKDDELAHAALQIENDRAVSAGESRARLRRQIEVRYTAPV